LGYLPGFRLLLVRLFVVIFAKVLVEIVVIIRICIRIVVVLVRFVTKSKDAQCRTAPYAVGVTGGFGSSFLGGGYVVQK